ncbi:MAG TPA: outer membrane lipoprotein-sorting protein, partial [Nevskiaceae bacterium]|nr:outer membrane lipoprotein-sorting protein [Nevskiaceae bacterium]
MKRACLLMLALCSVAARADEGADQMLKCMHANVPPTLRVQQIELTVTGREGDDRKLTGRLYAAPDAQGRLQAMLKIDAPADLAGAAYLVHESDDYLKDGMYVYLSSVKRVRRVSGTFADGALLGTHFSYNDFRQLQTAFAGTPATLEAGEDNLDGRPARILDFTPGADSRYSRVR